MTRSVIARPYKADTHPGARLVTQQIKDVCQALLLLSKCFLLLPLTDKTDTHRKCARVIFFLTQCIDVYSFPLSLPRPPLALLFIFLVDSLHVPILHQAGSKEDERGKKKKKKATCQVKSGQRKLAKSCSKQRL